LFREKQHKKEQETKERQEKKEREVSEKKERREKREAEKKKRDEEKRLKEESRKKKLEEKEQQKEEKVRQEEQAKMKFRSFFTKKPIKKVSISEFFFSFCLINFFFFFFLIYHQETEVFHSILTPFSIKDGMLLALPSRDPLEDMTVLDELLLRQDTAVNYLQTCKLHAARKPAQAWTRAAVEPMEVDDGDDSCQMWGEEKVSIQRKFKLLQFRENHRPAYYGTWSKPRGKINARNPFRMDNVSFYLMA